MADLVLFSRKGCCLCEGLEQRLRDLDLQALGLVLMVVDIDSPAVAAELRARYERVKARRHGVAIGEAVEGTCQACNFRLRPQLWLEVLNMETPVQCDNCQRILFARDALELPSTIKVSADD